MLLVLLLLVRLLLLLVVAGERETKALDAHGPGFGRELEPLEPLVMILVVGSIGGSSSRLRRQERVQVVFELLEEERATLFSRSCKAWP